MRGRCMICQLTTQPLPTGKYEHTCQVCGKVYIVRGKRLIANCKSSEPRLCLPGCQLTRLLERIGIEKQGGCNCEDYARQMDAWWVDGCKERIGEIVEHLREQATERGMLFSQRAATWLVKLAIKLAEQQRGPNLLERTALAAIRRIA